MLRLALLLLPAVSLAAAQREVIPFDFGWRFILGHPTQPWTCSASNFTANYTGQQCQGLAGIASARTAADCEQAACDANAEIWQWCNGTAAQCPPTKAFCWVGAIGACAAKHPEWLSFGRNSSSPVDPGPAAPDWPDADWAVVDAPHDALIGTPYRQNGTNNGQGSIPKNVSWYRKHFVLPVDWKGSHVEVYIEGAFSLAFAFLNGVPILNHTSGYTSFALRLDNVTGVVWGGENVLAIFIDGTVTTGW